MKYQTLVVIGTLTVTGCNSTSSPKSATQFASGVPGVTSVLADVASCPVGMTLIDSTQGFGAFCIDDSAQAATQDAADAHANCSTNMKRLCSGLEVMRANHSGLIDNTATNYYWISDVWAHNGAAYEYVYVTSTQGTTSISFSAPQPQYPSYCCTK